MTIETQTNTPVQHLRDGKLKATIWRNATKDGFRYSIQLQRIYEDKNGVLQNTDRFSGSELLRIARLAGLAYTAEQELRELDKLNASQAEGS